MNRKALQREIAARYRVITPERGSGARTAKMAARAERRARAKELRDGAKRRITREGGTVNRHQLREQFPFRPVYGHAIPAPDHKLFIEAMMTKDVWIASGWYERRRGVVKS